MAEASPMKVIRPESAVPGIMRMDDLRYSLVASPGFGSLLALEQRVSYIQTYCR